MHRDRALRSDCSSTCFSNGWWLFSLCCRVPNIVWHNQLEQFTIFSRTHGTPSSVACMQSITHACTATRAWTPFSVTNECCRQTTQGFYEVWGEGSTWEEVVAAVGQYPEHRRKAYAGRQTSFRVDVDCWGHSMGQQERMDLIDSCERLPLQVNNKQSTSVLHCESQDGTVWR